MTVIGKGAKREVNHINDMKNVILIIVFTCNVYFILAQNITGKIVNQKGEPLHYANVILQTLDNNTICNSIVPDTNGNFTFDYKRQADYLLEISCTGYDTVFIRLVNTQGNINLGKIILTEEAILLNEIIISPSHKNVKIDRQIIFPSEIQVQTSSSAYNLLNKIYLPSIKIDELQYSISSIGNAGMVKTCINGIDVGKSELIALNLKEILHIEYIDMPGIRYGENIGFIINFIVKQPNSGMIAGVNLTNTLTANYGNDNVYLKVNYKKSELGLYYILGYSDFSQYRDESICYRLSDIELHEIDRSGTNSSLDTDNHNIQLKYNLNDPGKYVFNVVLQSNLNKKSDNLRQDVEETEKNNYSLMQKTKDNSLSQVLDLYFQMTFPHKQNLVLNLTSTHINSDYTYLYQEYNPVLKYGYTTDGKKYSLIGEILYEKEYEYFKLSGGLHATRNYLNNVYTDTTVLSDAKMHNTSYYFYTQIQGKLKKFSYILGLGFTRQKNKQYSNGYSYSSFRPMVNLSYPVFNKIIMRYKFSIRPNQPPLSNLTKVSLQKNNWEIQTGNPDLKPFKSIMNDLIFNYQHSKFNVQATIGYMYNKNAFMPTIERINTNDQRVLFLFGGENQKSMNHLRGQIYVQYDIIPNKLTFEGYSGILRSFSNGNNFMHTFISFYGGGQAVLYFGCWNFTGGIDSRYKEFFGETVWYDAYDSNLQLSYSLKNMHFRISWKYPLQPQGQSSGTELCSSLIQKNTWTIVKNYGNMITLNFVWNMSVKRKYPNHEKLLNNMDRDTGIVK
ncbi:MAG: TonB-dependent receptor [Prevotellaceae bacterium]|jgi:hypothetical protein|nr:TonB-dependent receptor [Prevotellaceae bacterium]